MCTDLLLTMNHELRPWPWFDEDLLPRCSPLGILITTPVHIMYYYIFLWILSSISRITFHPIPLSLSLSLFCAWTTLKRTDEKKKKCLSKRFSSYQSICKPRDVEDEFIRICFSHLEQRLKHQIVFVARASSTINQKCIIERYIAIHRKTEAPLWIYGLCFGPFYVSNKWIQSPHSNRCRNFGPIVIIRYDSTTSIYIYLVFVC